MDFSGTCPARCVSVACTGLSRHKPSSTAATPAFDNIRVGIFMTDSFSTYWLFTYFPGIVPRPCASYLLPAFFTRAVNDGVDLVLRHELRRIGSSASPDLPDERAQVVARTAQQTIVGLQDGKLVGAFDDFVPCLLYIEDVVLLDEGADRQSLFRRDQPAREQTAIHDKYVRVGKASRTIVRNRIGYGQVVQHRLHAIHVFLFRPGRDCKVIRICPLRIERKVNIACHLFFFAHEQHRCLLAPDQRLQASQRNRLAPSASAAPSTPAYRSSKHDRHPNAHYVRYSHSKYSRLTMFNVGKSGDSSLTCTALFRQGWSRPGCERGSASHALPRSGRHRAAATALRSGTGAVTRFDTVAFTGIFAFGCAHG